jgi:hypothetical protein
MEFAKTVMAIERIKTSGVEVDETGATLTEMP